MPLVWLRRGAFVSGSTEWRTPPAFFANLHAEFGFNVDAAATDDNALTRPSHGHHGPLHVPIYGAGDVPRCVCGAVPAANLGGRYYTAETDGTKREHYGLGDRIWCNPPYSPAPLLYRFVETAYWTAREQGALWVMLLNASCTDTRWFHDFIWDDELHRPRERIQVRHRRGRISFLDENGELPRDKKGKPQGPRYSNMVCIFHPWRKT